jgi:hypothetical protein
MEELVFSVATTLSVQAGAVLCGLTLRLETESAAKEGKDVEKGRGGIVVIMGLWDFVVSVPKSHNHWFRDVR